MVNLFSKSVITLAVPASVFQSDHPCGFFTKFDMCIYIVEICYWIAHWKILSVIDSVSARDLTLAGYYCFMFYLFIYFFFPFFFKFLYDVH